MKKFELKIFRTILCLTSFCLLRFAPTCFAQEMPQELSPNITQTAQIKIENLQNFFKVKIASVYDGDTFKVYLACNYPIFCRQTGVRVKGIDCPEIKTKNTCEKQKAKEAKDFTNKFLKSGQVILRNCQKDKYFRILCDVKSRQVLEGKTIEKDLAQGLLAAKLAYAYDGGTKQKVDWCV